MANKELIVQIWELIKSKDKFTIATHVRPDGDTIGTAVALKNIILDNLENKEVKITGDTYPAFLKFLEKNDEVSDEYFNDSQVIVVDTSSIKRIFDKRVITKEAIKIDHHHEEEEWLLGIGGDHWPACGQLLVEMVKELGLKLTYKSKEALYVAIYTDTAGFTQRITNMDETIAAVDFLELSKEEQEVIVNKMDITPEQKAHIEKLKKEVIVEDDVAYLYTTDQITNDYYRNLVNELSNQEGFEVFIAAFQKEDMISGSLRSKGNFDVSIIAAKNNGGGHYSSAGMRLNNKEELDEMIKEIKEQLEVMT